MIDIILFKRDGINIGYQAEGHAEFDEPGFDVICAAVSVLTINTENAIDLLTDDEYTAEMNDDGFLRLMMTADPSHDTTVLLAALEIGVNAISESYGNDYIRIRTEEV